MKYGQLVLQSMRKNFKGFRKKFFRIFSSQYDENGN